MCTAVEKIKETAAAGTQELVWLGCSPVGRELAWCALSLGFDPCTAKTRADGVYLRS